MATGIDTGTDTIAVPRPWRLPGKATAHWALRYRRIWRATLLQSFLTPALFLAGMGLGLGSFVDDNGTGGAALGGVRYLAFLAPGLLASTVMQTANGEASWPVMGAVKWDRTYQAMLATPLGIGDIVIGHLAWMAVRMAQVSVAFVAMMGLFGAIESWQVALAVPGAVLGGLAFAAPIQAYAAGRIIDSGFAALTRFVITPMFLFSGVFFPVTKLPAGVRWVAYLTPLWHTVDLCRGLALERITLLRTVGHLGYLALFVVIGLLWSMRVYTKRLRS